ncbi:outer membrane beta-barrel protein [Metapseudomonas boanensis]|uniref:Outer membrane beta-barrel protein n=1 Tax=Metapseudomonas boanensis TaxID=2822138 RepID=A0ABS5XND9_9GAMM|nr:outer membrane beta-barrel protein [Pseudomonas boanensis]MBT8769180.1 outer membrane beta-barrel protein [Pseudomonas boanensis]
MIPRKPLSASSLLGPVLAVAALLPSLTQAAEPGPSGSLFRSVFGDSLEQDHGIKVHGWGQAGWIYNDNASDDVSKQAFFNNDEGFNLNQFALAIEKAPKGNVVGRVGPFPGPMPQEADWGFNITAIYGKDARFFKTYGFDEDLGVNRSADANDENFNIAQAFLDFYFPVLGGSNLMLGVFHTPLENDIGFALGNPAPADFYSHTYSFMHGPAKHTGALYSFKLPQEEDGSMLGFELGVVQGWNNMQDPNGDLDVIANLRWRSADFRTWVDWENIYGNGAGDSFAECACGSPIPAGTEDDNLTRYASYLTVSRVLDERNRVAAEFNYGQQEDAAFAGFADKDNAHWYGADFNWYHRLADDLMWNSRAEWFYTDAPVHVVMANIDPQTGIPDPSWGSFYGVTTNLSWTPVPNLRLRPELRYDIHSGNGRDAFGGGQEDRQLIGSFDITVFF